MELVHRIPRVACVCQEQYPGSKEPPLAAEPDVHLKPVRMPIRGTLFQFVMSHKRTDLSTDPETICVPSGEMAKLGTTSAWPKTTGDWHDWYFAVLTQLLYVVGSQK